MGFASSKSGNSTIWNKRRWDRRLAPEHRDRSECGHVWEYDPADRLMRCYKCGGARLPTETEECRPRLEGTDTEL